MAMHRGVVTRGMVALAAAALAAGCANRPLPAYVSNGAVAPTEYHLGTGDKLKIDTFGEQSLSGEYEVSAAGDVDFPLIGRVPARGSSPAQLADAIAARLSKGYVQNPKVNVQLLNYRPFYILGEVNKPGTYPYTVGLTVLNAVATAEGFTYRADTKRVFVHHMDSNREEQVPLSAATPVLPGDTIRIGERFF